MRAPGETYIIPTDPPLDHAGHTATVLSVRRPPALVRSQPSVVRVQCSCGETWTYEDVDVPLPSCLPR